MENEQKLYSFLGLCMKAGKLGSGELTTEKAVESGKAKLVIVSQDASDNTKKLFQDKCNYRKVPLLLFGDKERLGGAIGKSERSSLVITDKGMAQAFLKKYRTEESDGGETNGKN